METDLDFYTRSMIEALRAARAATSPEARRCYEQLAQTFAMQMHRVENSSAVAVHPQLRLRPLQLAA